MLVILFYSIINTKNKVCLERNYIFTDFYFIYYIELSRNFAGHLGVFEDTVEGLHTGYIVPQDSGRRADPR